MVPEIKTSRLLLRQWRDSDLDAYAALCSDPEVMRYFPKLNTREECWGMIERFRQLWNEKGFGPFAIEVPGQAECIGFVGLLVPRFETHFTPCVEIGWRLAKEYQGKGYATEAAQACLDAAFRERIADEIFSFTVPANKPSWRVMEKIGMQHVGYFDHPMIEDGHPLKKQVLYSVKA
jgi:RimJ/RimL family protein N-acetyltransferase